MENNDNKCTQLSRNASIEEFVRYTKMNNQEYGILISLGCLTVKDLNEEELYKNYLNSINYLKNLSLYTFTMDNKEFYNNTCVAYAAGYIDFKDLILAKEDDERNKKVKEIIQKACKLKGELTFID